MGVCIGRKGVAAATTVGRIRVMEAKTTPHQILRVIESETADIIKALGIYHDRNAATVVYLITNPYHLIKCQIVEQAGAATGLNL